MLKTANTSIDKTGTSDSGNPTTSNNPRSYDENATDLRLLACAWPSLPDLMRIAIMAMVEAAKALGEDDF